MPRAWVFPGGSVDPADGEGEAGVRACAVRELEEEAGIRLEPGAELILFSRWITPEFVKTRFDAWFFLALAPPHAPPEPDGTEIVDAAWYRPPGRPRCQRRRRAAPGLPDRQAAREAARLRQLRGGDRGLPGRGRRAGPAEAGRRRRGGTACCCRATPTTRPDLTLRPARFRVALNHLDPGKDRPGEEGSEGWIGVGFGVRFDSRFVMLRLGVPLAAMVAMLGLPSLASAHLERPSYWPDPAPDTSVSPPAGGRGAEGALAGLRRLAITRAQLASPMGRVRPRGDLCRMSGTARRQVARRAAGIAARGPGQGLHAAAEPAKDPPLQARGMGAAAGSTGARRGAASTTRSRRRSATPATTTAS